MDNSLLNDDNSFEMNGNGVTNSLNGHPSGKYSLKEITTSNNNSILQHSTVETKNTPGSISGTSVTINQGNSLLTSSSLPHPPNNAVTPTLSIRDKD